jgi:predicted RNA polymerase sigma factor
LARGTLLQKLERPADAVAEFDRAIPLSRLQPGVFIELVANKADLQVSMGDAEAALQTLENFAEDTQMPTDLRCEALLHSALIMRESGRLRPAMLTENRAVELADSPALKREIQYVVERIRGRAEKKVDEKTQ